MLLYIFLYIISRVSSLISSSISTNLTLTLPTLCLVSTPMVLSKPKLEKPEGIDLESIGYDYDTNWDNCDYVDPETLPDIVKAQDLLV